MQEEQPSLIYIVKPEEVPSLPRSANSYPNFTVPGTSDMKAAAPSATAADATKPTLSGIGLRIATMFATRAAQAVVPGGLPISTLVAVATYSPAIMQIFTKGKDEIPKELQKELEKQGTEDVEAFMREHACSRQMAEEADLIFPPGHPQIGIIYRRHPLAGIKSANKARVYIPAERYDEVLLEEREAELLRLLVHLGATQISITKNRRTANSSKLGATLSVTGPAANGEIASDAKTRKTTDEDQTRVFELAGKTWHHGEVVDRSSFAWASFEPSWDALIVAREIGGCTQADLEVREITTFSSDRSIAVQIAASVAKANAGVATGSTIEEESFYLIRAAFGRPISRAEELTLATAGTAG
ncbi:hypothetical protein [Ralstonia insidiosa]|uniref:Uncharacterized protein n=1 Tax=Ralstonia insidiosa TaxID=190721 RepID=A0A848NZK7_9RALS|nr:hypothetical protein [Ralstonia insidiosa]NMV37874.1 hypothetical protein [Ralstonia insidiosa]